MTEDRLPLAGAVLQMLMAAAPAGRFAPRRAAEHTPPLRGGGKSRCQPAAQCFSTRREARACGRRHPATERSGVSTRPHPRDLKERGWGRRIS